MSFAQELPAAITFSAVSAAGTVKDSTFAAVDLTLTTVDPDGKMSIDANPAAFSVDGVVRDDFSFRLKAGGKTNDAANPTKNYIKLNAAKAGKLFIAARTGSNSDATRTLIIKQGENELFNDTISEVMKDSVLVDEAYVYYYHYVAVDVAAGEITLVYPVNGLNFYGFQLKAAAVVPAGVTYVLPEGAVTNDYGWKDKSDMFDAFMADCGFNTHATLAEYKAMAEPLGGTGICGTLTNVSGAFDMTDKWMWLKQYIVDVTAAQIATNPTPMPTALAVTDANSAAWRYAVGAFFIDGQRATWPVSASFATAGSIEAFQPAWKHGFANPESVAEGEHTLSVPYMDNMTFDGWYTEANGGGTKVTKIDANTSGTLYAYFVPYINTVKEFIALTDGTKNVQVKGVVSFVQGNNFWIQDATGGILCYGKNHGLAEGEEAVLQGEKTTYKGSPEVNGATVVKHEAGTPVAPVTVMLSAIKTAETPYLNHLVYIEGLKMAEYQDAGSYKNPIVTDGSDSIILYNMGIEETAVPVGTKLNIKAVVGVYNSTMQLRGHAEWVEASSPAGKDATVYEPRFADGEFTGYTLQNEWIFANTFDNYTDNVPAPADNARGMAVKDGIMYFINRAKASFTRVNGATGLMLDPLPITGSHLFEAENKDSLGNGTGEWAGCATLAYNDMKFDNAGHALIGGCISGGNRFQIYKVDLTTGAATEVINERLYDDTTFAKIAYRFDAFGVYGDVDHDAVIMACNAQGWNAFRWNIKGGVAQPAELVTLSKDKGVKSLVAETDSADWNVANPGTAPQIFPLEGGMFYIDGWSTLPMLFDEGTENMMKEKTYDSYLIDDFANVPTGVVVHNTAEDSVIMNTGHNGLCEFQVGEDYFLLMAATNTVGKPTSAFALYKYKDASKSFAEMEPMWFFPQKGMGEATNGCRTAVPSVEVNGNVAKLYLYTNNNGYAVYTFTGKEVPDAIEDVEVEVKARKVIENGNVYIIRGANKYTVTGVQVK